MWGSGMHKSNMLQSWGGNCKRYDRPTTTICKGDDSDDKDSDDNCNYNNDYTDNNNNIDNHYHNDSNDRDTDMWEDDNGYTYDSKIDIRNDNRNDTNSK